MPEEIKDVKEPVETSSTEQVVENEAETTQPDTTEVTETKEETTQTEAGQAQADVDEQGVPWKNRAFEWKRKTEDLAERLPQMLEDAMSRSIGQRQQPQYTIEQLEAFVGQTDNPQYQQWAKGEIRKLEDERTAKLIRGEFEKVQKVQKDENIRKESLNYVMKNYPEAFQRDAQGNPLGWNSNHPLTKMMGELINHPDLKNRPDALLIASDIAYGRYARLKGMNQEQKNLQLKKEVKNLQKGTLIEGGGRERTSAVPAHKVAIEKLKQTGSMKDAQAALDAIMKARKASEEE